MVPFNQARQEVSIRETNPVANAGQSQTVNSGSLVTFDASGCTDNVCPLSYEWDFGDGTTGTGITTTYNYTNPGDVHSKTDSSRRGRQHCHEQHHNNGSGLHSFHSSRIPVRHIATPVPYHDPDNINYLQAKTLESQAATIGY